MKRLLDCVQIDDDGDARRQTVLREALERLLNSPTAQTLIQQVIEDRVSARIRFVPVAGSRLVDIGGRRIFFGARGFSLQEEDTATITLNENYLGGDDALRERDLPPTIAHELLGHCLWVARAKRERIQQAFHHHDLNEMNARLVGWLVDLELDGRLENSGASSYLLNPAVFRDELKFVNSYYALTFSTEEMRRPVEVMQSRLAIAYEKLQHIDLSPEVEDADAARERSTELQDIISALSGTLARCRAEPDHASETYFRWAADRRFFALLEQEVEQQARVFLERVQERLGSE